GSDCAEFLQAVAASGIYRRHFYGGHGRKTQLDCSSYIIINVSLTENVLNVFVVRTEGKDLAGQIVSEDSVYQSLKIVSGAPFADVYMDAAADLFQRIIKIRGFVIRADACQRICRQFVVRQIRGVAVKDPAAEKLKLLMELPVAMNDAR